MDMHAPYLQRCIDLARMGGISVSPNPMVGCVIVHQGRIIGEGFHQRFGGPHAEVNAIQSVADKSLLKHSILYVNLEPCNHQGKTPPCTDLIIRHEIPEVVIGCTDPNPKVAGSGARRLVNAGLKVQFAADSRPYEKLNEAFFVNIQKGRPFITLKWAESQEGYIAALDEKGKPIRTALSGRLAQRMTHRLRAERQAILIGAATWQIDRPALTTRLFPGPDPMPVLFDPASELLKTELSADGRKWIRVHSWNLMSNNGIKEIVESLYKDDQIGSILVEGGAFTLQRFFEARLWDEIFCIRCPVSLPKGYSGPLIPLNRHTVEKEEVLYYQGGELS